MPPEPTTWTGVSLSRSSSRCPTGRCRRIPSPRPSRRRSAPSLGPVLTAMAATLARVGAKGAAGANHLDGRGKLAAGVPLPNPVRIGAPSPDRPVVFQRQTLGRSPGDGYDAGEGADATGTGQPIPVRLGATTRTGVATPNGAEVVVVPLPNSP